MLSCQQMTSEPHDWSDKNFFVTVARNENKILVVDGSEKKYPSAVHHVTGKNSYEIVEQMSKFGNKLISTDRLLRWEKMLLTFQNGDKYYTCLVSPSAAKSFHDDDSDEKKVEIEKTTCETDNTLFVFARLCRKEGGKIITAADLTASTSIYISSYNGFLIKLWPSDFACVVKRGNKEIPIPSYCFIDTYQVNGYTMHDIFKDDLTEYDLNTPQQVIDEHVINAAFRKIEPYASYSHYTSSRKNCRYGRKSSGKASHHVQQKIGYQFKVGAGEEVEEVSQTEEMQQSDAGDNE